jgi:hypothetical protein
MFRLQQQTTHKKNCTFQIPTRQNVFYKLKEKSSQSLPCKKKRDVEIFKNFVTLLRFSKYSVNLFHNRHRHIPRKGSLPILLAKTQQGNLLNIIY